jgi:hypothetical protein
MRNGNPMVVLIGMLEVIGLFPLIPVITGEVVIGDVIIRMVKSGSGAAGEEDNIARQV